MHLIKSLLTSPFSSPSCGLKGIYCFLFAFTLNNALGQTNTFERTYNLGFGENANFVIQSSNGDFIIGGQQNIGFFDQKGFFIAIDQAGNQVYSKTLGDNGELTSMSNALFINDSTFVVIGESSSYNSNLQLLVWKFKTNGDSLGYWQYGDSSLEFGLGIDIVGEAAQFGFILCGGKADNQTFTSDAWVVRIDSFGNKLWDRSLNLQQRAFANNVRTTNDGGFIVTGTIYNNLATNGPTAFLWKLDSLGNTNWINYYGAESYLGYGFDVLQKPTGGYLMCGFTGFYDAPRNLWLNVPYILSTDEQGDTLWTWKNDYPREGILQAMVIKGNELWISGTWLNWGGDYDLLLLRFNLDSKEATYTTFGDGSTERGGDIVNTIDGSFAIIGTKSNSQNVFAYFIKTDNNGCVQPGCMQAVSVQEHLQANLNLKIYPNPVIDQLNIESNFEHSQLQLQISDMQGRTVHSEQQASNTNIQLQLSHLPAGMYLLRIQNGQQTAWARFVKR
jgi:hypothetical protein